MNCTKLTISDRTWLKEKKIYCFEKSKAYLKELCDQYGVKNNIMAIFDDNPRNQEKMIFEDREIAVYAMQRLRDFNLKDAVLLITSDYYKEYFDKISEILGNHTFENIYFFANTETEYELFYRNKYENAPLENIIVFRSGPHANAYVKGMDFSDNARALFEYSLSIKLNNFYKLVWIVKDPKEYQDYQKYYNVVFLPFDGSISLDKRIRDQYYKVLCLAKYFFFTDAYGFVRNCRKDQIRVQLWHGCGFKKRLSKVACSNRYDYMTVTSDLYARLHAEEFGLKIEQLIVTGLPKEDWLFEPKKHIFNLLHIPLATKYVFWLPTYRFSEKTMNKPVDGNLYEETGLPLIDSYKKLEELNEKLVKDNTILIIKIHPFQDEDAIHVEQFSNIIKLDNEILIKNDIQINQVLGMADALVSDYSSTAVDYLMLNRPMAFLIEDVKSYSDNRGYIFDDVLKWLPGRLVTDFCGFSEFFDEVAENYDSTKEKRNDLLKKMHKYKDNNSCKRVMQTLGIIKE